MRFLKTTIERRAREDDGAALMVALIFILVVGIMVTAALSKSGAVMTTDLKVRDTGQIQYAVDGGVDRALQVLRDDLSNTNPNLCPTTGSSSTDYGSGDSGGVTINGHIVHYKCTTTNGSVASPGASRNSNFAIVTTNSGADSLQTKNGAGNPIPVNGSIYVAGKEDNNAVPGIKKEIDIANADLLEYDQGDFTGCKTNIAALSKVVITTSGFNKVCGSQTPAEATPQVQLPAAPSMAAAYTNPPSVDLTTGGANCRVFLPGYYTTPPALLNAQSNGANYFFSGLYYFYKSSGFNWNINTGQGYVVYAGQPNTARSDTVTGTQIASSGCKDFANQDSASGLTTTENLVKSLFTTAGVDITTWPNPIWNHGVQFVMGNGAGITVGKASLSLASPDPDPVGNRSVSLIAARANSWFTSATTTDVADGYTPWTSAGGTVLDSTASNADTVINGKLLAPDADVAFFGTQPGADVIKAGVVARTLNMDASSAVSADQFVFTSDGVGSTNGPPPQRRTVKIISCSDTANPSADCTSSTSSTTLIETTVATIDNFGTRPIRVYSWQVN